MKTQIETTPRQDSSALPQKRTRPRLALRRYTFTLLFVVLFIMGVFTGRWFQMKENVPIQSHAVRFRSLEEIIRSGHITVVTLNSPYCYYRYRKQNQGFEYDLAAEFAKYLGVELSIWVSDRRENLIPDLLDGKGDFIAANFSMTMQHADEMGYSDGYLPIKHEFVIPRGQEPINSPQDLAGKTIHVEQGSSHQADLESLRLKGIGIQIVTHPTLTADELIGEVEDKKIDMTIADHHIAMLNRRYYPKIIIGGTLNDLDEYRWGFPQQAWALAFRINHFLSVIKANGKFFEIFNHYFEDVGSFDYLDIRTFHHRMESLLPTYRHWIEEAASKHGFDWRLIAAQIYQESHFDPEAISQDGAYGLMQITAGTGECFGVKDLFDPEENIRAGTGHLKNLYEFYDKAEDPDRLFIALSAYNIGQGHIKDARDLARSKNLNPEKWASLAETLLLLEQPDFSQNALYGFCRGTEPVVYIQQIKVYYDILRRQGIELSMKESGTPEGMR
jgi:membrane-bound lytic murein transglycosylase F